MAVIHKSVQSITTDSNLKENFKKPLTTKLHWKVGVVKLSKEFVITRYFAQSLTIHLIPETVFVW